MPWNKFIELAARRRSVDLPDRRSVGEQDGSKSSRPGGARWTCHNHRQVTQTNLTMTEIYRRSTAPSGATRTRTMIRRFFDGLDLVDPGLVWVSQW